MGKHSREENPMDGMCIETLLIKLQTHDTHPVQRLLPDCVRRQVATDGHKKIVVPPQKVSPS